MKIKIDINIYSDSIKYIIERKESAENISPILFNECIALLNRFVNEVINNEKRLFATNFAKLNFIYNQYGIDEKLQKKIRLMYSFNNILWNNQNKKIFCSIDDLDFALSTLIQFINKTSETEISDFQNINPNAKLSAFSRADFSKTNHIEFTSLIIVKREKLENGKQYFICKSETWEEVHLYLYDRWKDLFKLAWKGAKVNLFDVKLTVSENRILTASGDSIVVLEPDYMLDATEIAECFGNTGATPYINILKKILTSRISSSLIVGNIVNSLFDSLIVDELSDFNTVYEDSLKQRMMSAFALAAKSFEESSNLRHTASQHYENLRRIVPTLKNDVDLFVEPSFISPIYGIKGRLDLMQDFKEENGRKDIIELKSGRPPSKDYFYRQNKKAIKTGLWNNHLAQTTCYNLLLDSTFENRSGTSIILYSGTSEYPLRDAPNIHTNKQDVIHLRNSIVAIERQIAMNNFSIFESIILGNIEGIPKFMQNDIKEISTVFEQISELEKKYFYNGVAYLFREIFAINIGAFSKRNDRALSNLWSESGQQINNPSIISHLELNYELSKFDKGYLYFNTQINQNISQNDSSLREGDIIILVPDDGKKIYNNQLIKGSIREITDNYIFISLRNKMMNISFFKKEKHWKILSDISDINYKKVFSKLSNFLKADSYKKNIILGLQKPEFNEIKELKVEGLTENQNLILNRVVSAKNYFLIQGPPGTGKTSYMLKSIVEHLSNNNDEVILLTAYTNRAVDEICNAIEKIESKPQYLRLGSKESSSKEKVLLSKIAEEKNINELYKLVKKTKIFCATVSYLVNNNELFEMKKFNTIIIDEASQIVETQLVGLLTNFDKFILIGDEKQLPAISLQDESNLLVVDEDLNKIHYNNLGDSLFSRLLKICKQNQWSDAYAMLNKQARMHKDIQEFPNKYFYENRLTTLFDEQIGEGVNEFNSDSTDSLEKILAKNHSVFITTNPEPNRKVNYAEVEIVKRIVEIVYNNNPNEDIGKKIGIISPFKLQCAEIRRSLPKALQNEITVDTVERFQGSERDIIIISLAVNFSFDMENIISIADINGVSVDRKLNVALTRAKKNLIILGSPSIIRNNKIYAQLLDYHKENLQLYNYSKIQ